MKLWKTTGPISDFQAINMLWGDDCKILKYWNRNRIVYSKKKIPLHTTRNCRPELGHGISDHDWAVFYISPGFCFSCPSIVEIPVESRSTRLNCYFDGSNLSRWILCDSQTWEIRQGVLWWERKEMPKEHLDTLKKSTKSCWWFVFTTNKLSHQELIAWRFLLFLTGIEPREANWNNE